jgi:hypothetical protein
MPLEFNPSTPWLTSVWTVLNKAARLQGMADDFTIHYAIRLIKKSSLVPVYESTPLEMIHSLGDCCWTEIVFLYMVVSECAREFGRWGITEYEDYTWQLAHAIHKQICGWESYADYLSLLNEMEAERNG